MSRQQFNPNDLSGYPKDVLHEYRNEILEGRRHMSNFFNHKTSELTVGNFFKAFFTLPGVFTKSKVETLNASKTNPQVLLDYYKESESAYAVMVQRWLEEGFGSEIPEQLQGLYTRASREAGRLQHIQQFREGSLQSLDEIQKDAHRDAGQGWGSKEILH